MMTLRELAHADRANVFMCADDFAEYHVVNGEDVLCVLDNDTFERNDPLAGVERAHVRLFAPAESFDYRYESGDVIEVDDALYIVESWTDDMGMAVVVMSRNQ